MMGELGKYAVPVLASWGAGLIALAAIIGHTLWSGYQTKRDLARVEAAMKRQTSANEPS